MSLSLPGGDTEYDFIDDGYGIRCEREGGKLVFWLEDWFSHKFDLYLRTQGSYTKVYVDVVRRCNEPFPSHGKTPDALRCTGVFHTVTWIF